MARQLRALIVVLVAVAGCYRTSDPTDASVVDATSEAAVTDVGADTPDVGADAGLPCLSTSEICDGIDDDCDGLIDEEPEASNWCGARCGVDECPRARPVAPLANALLTTQQPTFRWALVGGADAARVEVCRDRACADVLARASGVRSAVVGSLPRGPVFWRLIPQRGGVDLPAVSPPWIAHVPAVGTSTAPDGTTSIAVDVDADGWSDLLVPTVRPGSTYLSSYTLYTGSPDGLVRRAQLPDTFGVVATQDFDGDGHTDAYGGDTPPDPTGPAGIRRGAPAFLLGASSGPLSLALAQPPHAWRDAMGDVDQDGFPDLFDFAASSSRAPIAIAAGGPDGMRAVSVSIPTPTYDRPELPSQVFPVGDLDGDGTADFVAVQACDPTSMTGCPATTALWCIQGSPAGFLPARACALMPPVPDREPPCTRFPFELWPTGDLDGDGAVDLYAQITSCAGAGHLDSMLLLQRDASPTAISWSSLAAEWIGPACDFDGDGAGDLVLVERPSASTADTFVQRGSPSGLAAEHIHLASLAAVASRCLGDSDGDGFAEIAVLLYDPTGFADPWTTDTYVLHVYRGAADGVDTTPVQVIPIGRGQPWLY